jgi:hypothetical protein
LYAVALARPISRFVAAMRSVPRSR